MSSRTPWILIGLGMLPFVLASALRPIFEDGGTVGSILGGVATVSGAIYLTFRWWRSRRPFEEVTFLIPREQYRARHFPGAPSEERRLKEITVGVGEYIVALHFLPKIDLVVDEVLLDFLNADGYESLAVDVLRSDNLFVVEVDTTRPDGRTHLRDWNGIIHNAGGPGPLFWRANEPRTSGFRIQTRTEFSGYARLRFVLRNAPATEHRLRFSVSAERDEIAFLRTSVLDTSAGRQ